MSDTTIYIASADGVEQAVADIAEDGSAHLPWFRWVPAKRFRLTNAEAVELSRQMRIKRIASLRKQIAKLEKLGV